MLETAKQNGWSNDIHPSRIVQRVPQGLQLSRLRHKPGLFSVVCGSGSGGSAPSDKNDSYADQVACKYASTRTGWPSPRVLRLLHVVIELGEDMHQDLIHSMREL